MKKLLILLASVSLILFVGCKSELEKINADDTVYTYEAVLASPTDDALLAGNAKMVFKDDKGLNLKATFANLKNPTGTDYYEGWLVKDAKNLVSTGRVSNIEGFYVNMFSSDTDYSSYLKYILTEEVDDGNAAPSDKHILEGTFELAGK